MPCNHPWSPADARRAAGEGESSISVPRRARRVLVLRSSNIPPSFSSASPERFHIRHGGHAPSLQASGLGNKEAGWDASTLLPSSVARSGKASTAWSMHPGSVFWSHGRGRGRGTRPVFRTQSAALMITGEPLFFGAYRPARAYIHADPSQERRGRIPGTILSYICRTWIFIRVCVQTRPPMVPLGPSL